MKEYVNIEASHLMRCLAWNAMQITLINESVNYAQQAAKGHFAVGMTLVGKTILKDVYKFKKEIARLTATQKAIKEVLRTGWRYGYKKHGTMDANGNMHPAYKAFIENCKP